MHIGFLSKPAEYKVNFHFPKAINGIIPFLGCFVVFLKI